MSITAASLTDRTSLPRTTIAVGAVAAVITAGTAGALHAAGASLNAHGDIPIAAFAQFTFVGAILGGLMVAYFNRRLAAPRRSFVQTSATLTALTCIAPLALAQGAGSVLALIATHLVAAATIIPVLARRTTV
jgi:hypothetical protein